VYAARGERSPPVHLQEALARQDEAEQWRAACVEELESLQSKGVYSLVELPQGATSIPSMWVFAYKLRSDGQIERYKSRLVAKGYAQRPGVDYNEVWAPTGCLPVLRCLFAYAAAYDYAIIQADIRTAFLNGPLEDDIYLRQPPGFSDNTNRVWKLHKALYGLKQGARAWYLQLRSLLMSLGYVPMQADPATFVNKAKKINSCTHMLTISLCLHRADILRTWTLF
jgi:Reverse transcriptase (RNA-dependent DNA polymerase)